MWCEIVQAWQVNMKTNNDHGFYDLDESDFFLGQPKLKVVMKEKKPQQIVNPSIWTPWLQVTINIFCVL